MHFQERQYVKLLLVPSKKKGLLQKERICSKTKLGANSFLLVYTSFQKGIGVQESKKEVTKVVSLISYEK